MSVKQIENLLRLLEFFSERQQPATLADVVAHFGWPRSSAFNILTTLVETGYLYEPRARAGFYPSPRWLQLAQAIAAGEPIPERLIRVMRDVAAETGETVWISAPSGLHAVFVDVVEAQAGVRYAASAGNRVPIHATASGQALLSQMPDRDLGVLLRRVRFERYAEHSPMSIDAVLAQIAAGRRRGWFSSASHYSPDLGGVAVPVVDGHRIYAVTVAGPLYRVADKTAQHARCLRDAIRRIYGPDHSRLTLRNVDRHDSAECGRADTDISCLR